MDESNDLTALARKCRQLAAATHDEATRKALEALASHYESQRTAAEEDRDSPEQPAPKLPIPRE